MRILFTISVLLMLSSKAISQNYVPFPDSSAMWVNTFYTITPDFSGPWPVYHTTLTDVNYYCANGQDTVINNRAYTQVHHCYGGYKGALRDSAGKVMFVPKDSLQEWLAYDFTLQTGSSATVYAEGPLTNGYQQTVYVMGVDTVVINGVSRRRLAFEVGYWIEGIGSTTGLFSENLLNVSYYSLDLHCMSYNDTTLYPAVQPGICDMTVGVEEAQTAEEAANVYPNPTAGLVTISGFPASQINDIAFINSMGQSIDADIKIEMNSVHADLTNYPPGVYIAEINTSSGMVRKKVIRN